MYTRRMITFVTILGAIGVGAVTFLDGPDAGAAHHRATAKVVIQGTSVDEDVHGTVTFIETETGAIQIAAHVNGLTPGKHGIHIHEFGDISAEDGTSAGGHFAPMGHKHGLPGDGERHVGDLGNLEADENGHAMFTMTNEMISIEGENSIVGRALIIHAKPDKGVQPTGDAGARVGMGVIGIGERQ